MKEKITQQTVTFLSEGDTLKGTLYLPENAESNRKLPAVIVTGSWTTVKEQMPAAYAQRLAEQGYAALAFDFRGYGESEGTPRNYESPEKKAQDIKNAVTFLQSLPNIDPERISGLGICASAGYMAVAASQDQRIKSLALVAPWLHDAAIAQAIYGGEEGVNQRLALAEEARKKFESTGVVDYAPACSAEDENAAMYGHWDYYLNPQRGAIDAWANQFAVMAWNDWLKFDAHPAAKKIESPTLLVHSENAAVPEGAKQFYQAMSAPKEIVWLDGAQFDFYDQEPQVSKSVELVRDHFARTL